MKLLYSLFSIKYIRFTLFIAGVALGEACSIVLRGATQQILDEAERSLHDALCVMAQTVKETRTVFGGGKYSPDFDNDAFMHVY
jgi:chaperonin GroEL (HSP60 family)